MVSRFPYTDYTKINLDWIMRRLKEQISSAVVSVNGKSGVVTLDANDVGALPDSYTPPVTSVNLKTGDVQLNAEDVDAFPDVQVVNTAGEDIDTYTSLGIWYFPAAYLPLHAPTYSKGGFLVVLRANSDARMVQLWFTNTTIDNNAYIRNNAANNIDWSDWRNFTDGGGTVKRNSEFAISQFLAIAKTYYDNRASIVYGNDTFLDDAVINNQLDCSTFVGLCLRGIPFEDTPLNPNYTGAAQDPTYWKANRNYSWSYNPYDYNITSVRTGRVRGASQLAKLMVLWNQQVVMDENFANLEPGDIIFYSAKNADDTWKEPNTWGHVSHVAICYSKSDTPLNNYPYTHTVMDTHSGYTPAISISTLETSNHRDEISFVCRPDLGAVIPKTPDNVSITIPAASSYFDDSIRVSAYQVDKLVCLRISLVRSAEAKDNSYRTIASGLPIPALPAADDLSRTINYGCLTASDGSIMFVTINSSGNLRVALGEESTRYTGTIFYYCE